MNKVHISPTETGGLGNQHPHLPTAAIGQHPGWIQAFNGGASRHEQTPATPIHGGSTLGLIAMQGTLRRQLNQLWGSHASITHSITGEQAWRGSQSQHAVIFSQQIPIAANGGMAPHPRVHGCCCNNGAFAGQQNAGQQSIPEALRPSRQGGGTEWGHDH